MLAVPVQAFIASRQISKLLMHYGCKSKVGKKMVVSFCQLVVELGLTVQPLLEPYDRYKGWVTWSWMVAL